MIDDLRVFYVAGNQSSVALVGVQVPPMDEAAFAAAQASCLFALCIWSLVFQSHEGHERHPSLGLWEVASASPNIACGNRAPEHPRVLSTMHIFKLHLIRYAIAVSFSGQPQILYIMGLQYCQTEKADSCRCHCGMTSSLTSCPATPATYLTCSSRDIALSQHRAVT